MRRPNFFIIGAPKCGTTSLATYLGEHPKIFMSHPKEPCFFCSDIAIGGRFRSLPAYEQLFARAGPEHLAVGEGSTNYLFSNVAVPAILEYAPFARFIVMLRNPIEMAPSLHAEVLFHLADDLEQFEAAWNAQGMRQRGHRIPETCSDPQLLLYGERCLLGAQLERLYQTVSKERVLVVLMDDLRDQPKENYERVLAFLGVPTDGRIDFPIANVRRTTRSVVIRRALSHAGAFKRRLFGKEPTGILAPLHRINMRPASHTALPENLERQMRAYFSADVRKLEGLVERDLSHWC